MGLTSCPGKSLLVENRLCDKIVSAYSLKAMTTMPSRAKPLPADERRAVTVEAVVQLAAEQNPNDITTASIATRMGLTHGALFRHFPTKDAILQAVMEWVAERDRKSVV